MDLTGKPFEASDQQITEKKYQPRIKKQLNARTLETVI